MFLVRAIALKSKTGDGREAFQSEIARRGHDVLVAISRKLLLENLLAETFPAVAIKRTEGRGDHGGV